MMNPGGDALERAKEFRRAFAWGIPARKVTRRKVSPLPSTLVELGRLEEITYRTAKAGESARLFEHRFGEDGGKKPSLAMDIENKRLHILGGDYTVSDRGIED
jgi:hypothetical protein